MSTRSLSPLQLVIFSALIGACSARDCGGGGGPTTRLDSGPGTLPNVDGGPMVSYPVEVCGDAIDNTGEGAVDEGCECPTEGEARPCWPGSYTRRGLGICHDGFQYCERFSEFLAWGTCGGAQLPEAEIVGNCIDEDCDGDAPGCSASCFEFEDCAINGIDEDCNGRTDCDDPACAGSTSCPTVCVPAETGEQCTDRMDNDCDGIIDCADGDCASNPACDPGTPTCTREFPFVIEISCNDGRDNDCDGRVDCADPDCKQPGQCGCASRETMCHDGTDEDCDDSVDCADTECQRCTPGTFRWCDDPVYCHWGKQDCNSDGTWGDCIETTQRPGSCTGDLYSASCCVSAGGCCQNYPVDNTSIGSCGGIVTCL